MVLLCWEVSHHVLGKLCGVFQGESDDINELSSKVGLDGFNLLQLLHSGQSMCQTVIWFMISSQLMTVCVIQEAISAIVCCVHDGVSAACLVLSNDWPVHWQAECLAQFVEDEVISCAEAVQVIPTATSIMDFIFSEFQSFAIFVFSTFSRSSMSPTSLHMLW